MDTFTYIVTDHHTPGLTDQATVAITVSGRNDPVTANDDTDRTDEATAVTIGVVTNDTDPDTHDTLSVISVDTATTLGQVDINGDGTVTWNPDGRFTHLGVGQTATDTFTYTAGDGNGSTDTATVTVTIDGINEPPEALDDTATTGERRPVTIRVLDNDSDSNGDPLTITDFDDSATTGMVYDNMDGTFTYDPAGRFSHLFSGQTATDTFTYTIDDGNGGADTATVTIIINGRGQSWRDGLLPPFFTASAPLAANDGPTGGDPGSGPLGTVPDRGGAFTTGLFTRSGFNPYDGSGGGFPAGGDGSQGVEGYSEPEPEVEGGEDQGSGDGGNGESGGTPGNAPAGTPGGDDKGGGKRPGEEEEGEGGHETSSLLSDRESNAVDAPLHPHSLSAQLRVAASSFETHRQKLLSALDSL